MRRTFVRFIAAAACTATLAACGGSSAPGGAPSTSGGSGATGSTPAATQSPSGSGGQSPVATESPVPPENAPPGDIPDNTAYVPYHSTPGGFTISVPEGWSRTTTHGSVTFTDKLNTIQMSWKPTSSAPTVATATSTEVPELQRTTRAFTLKKVSAGSLPAGPTVLIEYQINSDPNPVTGKQYRLDVLRYELFHNGNEVALTLLSPVGADNVDPWRIVTESLKWH